MLITESSVAESRERGRRSLLHEPPGGDARKLTLVRARGSLVWDQDGREYIDCTSQAWSNNLGAGDPRVIDAAIEQTRRITHARATFHTEPLLELADLLISLAPDGMDRVGLTLHGSMAIEMALKLALRNRPAARHVITLQDAYHGRSITTMAASWPHPSDVFAPLQPSFVRVPHPDPYRPRAGLDPATDTRLCLELLEDTITKGVDGGVAAIMYEPIQGNGGHIEMPAEWHQGLRAICDRHGILMILDEVQTGFGRAGTIWAAEHYGIRPDILVFGKAVGGGFPLAGILAHRDLRGFEPGDDQLTFGQFPVAIAAGLAAVRAILADDLPGRAVEHGRFATERLLEMQARHPLIGHVRCPGLMVAIELVQDRTTKEPATRAAHEVYRRGLEHGVIFGESRYGGLGNLIKIKPPLDIKREQLSRALDVLDVVLTEIEQDRD